MIIKDISKQILYHIPILGQVMKAWEQDPSKFYKGEKFELKFKKQATWVYVPVKTQQMYI